MTGRSALLGRSIYASDDRPEPCACSGTAPLFDDGDWWVRNRKPYLCLGLSQWLAQRWIFRAFKGGDTAERRPDLSAWSAQFGLRPDGGRGDKRDMKFLCLLAWLSLAPMAVWAAEPARFSARLTSEQFKTAGLDKLTPEQLAALDRFVAGENEVETAAAVKEAVSTSAVAKETASSAAPKAIAPAATPKPRSLLVRLLPGTRIEYETVETRLVGEFRGWEGRTRFRLENGQVWRQNGGDNYSTPPVSAPRVWIEPGALGAFFLRIEGVNPRVKVELVP